MSTMREALVDVALGAAPPDIVIRGGNLVNVLTHEIYPTDILIKGKRIAAVGDSSDYDLDDGCLVIDVPGKFIAPGFMDPHFHIESSSITVTELTKLIVPRGVTMVAEDPHEIANVLGMEGIKLLFEEGKHVPLNFLMRVPGRVPPMDESCGTSGASLSIEDTVELLGWPEALCLAGDIAPSLVLSKDAQQYQKIDYTISQKMTVSGQSPGLHGRELNALIAAGLEDSHVSATVEEILDILRHGLKALLTHRPTKLDAADFAELARVVKQEGLDTRNLLLHTDDTHANQLREEGHLEYRMRLAIENGFDPVTAIQMATINVAEYFRITRDYGSVSPGRFADIVILDNLETLAVDEVFIHGKLVAKNGELVDTLPKYYYPMWAKQSVHVSPVIADDLKLTVTDGDHAQVRVIVPGTPKELQVETLSVVDGTIMPDPSRDIASVAVVERHKGTGNIGKGFFKFALKAGAYASSVTHDFHNIFVIGTNFDDMALAVNHVIANQGGYAVAKDGEVLGQIKMPVAGLISEEPFDVVAEKMAVVERLLREELGCTLPYRPLYFLNLLPLPNVPKVGVTDKGIISTMEMAPIEVFVQAGE